jgi:hypothetical protein
MSRKKRAEMTVEEMRARWPDASYFQLDFSTGEYHPVYESPSDRDDPGEITAHLAALRQIHG